MFNSIAKSELSRKLMTQNRFIIYNKLMTIEYRDLPQVLSENDRAFFGILEATINSVDELSTLEVRKGFELYHFRITTSSPSYISPLIAQLNELHNLFTIKVDFSKSIKSASSISYKIPLTFS